MNMPQEQCYRHSWVIQEIRRAVSSVAHKVTNTSALEERVMKYVGNYIEKKDSEAKNRKYIRRLIYQKIAQSMLTYRIEKATHLASLSHQDEDGQEVEYEPQDVLANVASGNLEIKETITLLAKDDRRKEFVLNAWANGYMDDTEISHILADVFTGQATGHLSFIKRFRKTCKVELAALAV